MSGFIQLFMTIYNFMRDTPIMTLNVGEFSSSITFLQLLIGSSVAMLGVHVIHKIVDW